MKIKLTPKEHQREAIKLCLNSRKFLVCHDTGSGKTVTMLCIAYLQMEHYDIDNTIIVATNSAIRSITNEMKKTFDTEPITLEDLQEGKKGVLLIAYQNVNKKFIDSIPQGRYTLIFDEYHKLKSPKTQTTKLCTLLKRRCVNCYGFTATPISKDFRDLYELIRFLNPLIFTNWETFCKDYTLFYKMNLPNRNFPVIKPYKYRNLEKLKRTLKPIMHTYFPEANLKWLEIMIPLEDVEGYRRTREEALTPTGDEQKDKALPMHAVKKCKRFVALSKGKLKALYKVVKEHIDRGVIVYCDEYATLNPVYKFLKDICKFDVLKYTGVSSQKEKDKSFNEFTSNASGKVLLLSRVGGASLNLQATNHLVTFDLPSSLLSVQQLVGRVKRMDSAFIDEGFYIHMLITETSVEHYWLEFIKTYEQPLKQLLNSNGLPKGMPPYNEYLKKKLINDKVWNR